MSEAIIRFTMTSEVSCGHFHWFWLLAEWLWSSLGCWMKSNATKLRCWNGELTWMTWEPWCKNLAHWVPVVGTQRVSGLGVCDYAGGVGGWWGGDDNFPCSWTCGWCYATWWGVMLTSFELASMVVMLRNMLGGVVGVMLKSLELAYMEKPPTGIWGMLQLFLTVVLAVAAIGGRRTWFPLVLAFFLPLARSHHDGLQGPWFLETLRSTCPLLLLNRQKQKDWLGIFCKTTPSSPSTP